MRNNKLYHTLETNKAGIKFRSSALASLNEEYQECKTGFAEQQRTVVAEIVNIAGESAPPWSVPEHSRSRS